MTFDPVSALLSLTVASLAVLWIGRRQYSQLSTRSALFYYMSYLFLMISLALIALREELPAGISFHLSQLLSIAAGAALITAQRMELRKPPIPGLLLSLIAINMLVFSIMMVTVSEPVRLIYVTVVAVALHAWIFNDARKLCSDSGSKAYRLFAAGVFLALVTSLLRLGALILGVGSTRPLGSGADLPVYFLSYMSGVVLMVAGYVGWQIEQSAKQWSLLHAEKELAQSKHQEAELAKKQIETSLSERDEMLRRAARSSRLATAQALSASISHEITQPLTALSLDYQHLLDLLQEDTARRPDLAITTRNVEKQLVRVIEIVRRIRALTANQEINLKAMTLQNSLSSSLTLLEREASLNEVIIANECSHADIFIQGDEILIQQVIMIVMINAIQALRGTATQPKRIRITSALDTDKLILQIADNGPGVAAEVRTRLFEAFASDKPDGTGMGLAIASSIMHRLGGEISLAPAPSGGECVTLCFARAKLTEQ